MTLGLVCDACDTLSPLSATVCSVCGAALGTKSVPGPTNSPRSCPNCASEIPGQHRFCGFCGTRADGTDTKYGGHYMLLNGVSDDGKKFSVNDGGRNKNKNIRSISDKQLRDGSAGYWNVKHNTH